MSIAYQLSFVRGTLPEDVTLVAVSKTHPAGAIREAYDAGQGAAHEGQLVCYRHNLFGFGV